MPQAVLVSKFAATKNALTGRDMTVDGEDPADYDTLRVNLYTEHAPQSEQEAMLVECIAQTWWKLQRLENFENRVLNSAHNLAFFAEKSFCGFVHYKSSIERTWTRARKELAELKKVHDRIATAIAKTAKTESHSELMPKCENEPNRKPESQPQSQHQPQPHSTARLSRAA